MSITNVKKGAAIKKPQLWSAYHSKQELKKCLQ